SAVIQSPTVSTATTAATGTYYVTATDANGCSNTASIAAAVSPAPTPSIVGTTTFCAGRAATLDAGTYPSTPNTYDWSNGANTQVIAVTTAGIYTVTVTNNDACSATALVEVTADACLANAGTVVTNSSSICPGEDVTISATGDQQATGYQQQYFLYSEGALGATTYVSSSATGVFSGITAGDYLVCAYNEFQACPPSPSPLTTNLDDINTTGTTLAGCFDFDCQTITMGGTLEDIDGSVSTFVSSTGQNVFVVEVCGGVQPYDEDLTATGGFASVQEYSSTTPGCSEFQVVYVNGVDWTLTILDANGCGGSSLTYTSDGVQTVLQPQITSNSITPETCYTSNGAISIVVEHGDNSCGSYTANWTGPNYIHNTTFSSTTLPATHAITLLASGVYDVTVTDCAGAMIVGQYNVNRLSSSGGGRRGRGGCKTALGEDLLDEVNVFPNPFNHTTTIAFSLLEDSYISLSVYAMDGRLVKDIFEGDVAAGRLQRMDFDASDQPAGMYILQLKTETGTIHYEQLSLVK
ncbi:MAG: T9SS type A sorting domain-containing protein, partial [Chitinophagales bacterium]